MVMRKLFADCCTQLREAGIPDAPTDVRILIDFVMGKGALFAARYPQYEPNLEEYGRLTKLIQQRAAHVPVAYLLGEKEFMGLSFVVNPHVLIPRGDTECLVEAALDCLKQDFENQAARVLDIGTGSGAIAVSMAKYWEQAVVSGIDISDAALQTAEKNAQHCQVAQRCRFWNCDIMKEIPEGSYDMVLSNPPYIPPDVLAGLEPDVRDYEPRGALTDEKDGLDFYRRISLITPKFLKKRGVLFLEIGCEQERAVVEILKNDGWNEISVRHDLAGRPRVVSARRS